MNYDQTLRKPNAALVMFPKTGKLTSIERKLFNSILLSSISQLLEYREKNGRNPDHQHLYCASASELLDPIERGKSNLKSSLRKNMLSLRRAEVNWEAPDKKSGIIWENMSVLSHASIELRNGRLFALWALPPGINEAISDIKAFPFTRLDLTQIGLLNTYTAVALYEICARYRNNFMKGGDGICLTTVNNPDWWIDALTNNSVRIDAITGIQIRREWRKVKSELVLPAINDINEQTDLSIELLERKKGRTVELIQFSVRQKRIENKNIRNDLLDLYKFGEKLGIRTNKIDLLLMAYAHYDINIALSRFEIQINKDNAVLIDNVNAYFEAILKQVAFDMRSIPNEPGKQMIDNDSVLVDAIGQGANSTNYDLVKIEFLALPDNEKLKYSELALTDLRQRGLDTPTIILHASEHVWKGILLCRMIEIFGDSKYGSEWKMFEQNKINVIF